MATPRTKAEIAFAKLRADDGTGIRTSNGVLFNHTIFARDVCMIGRWIVPLGPEFQQISKEIILTLSYHQGVEERPKAEEQPGRIHNEFRDYNTWQAPWWLKLGGHAVSLLWGGSWRRELTYVSLDTTPLYILLVTRYVDIVGPEILDQTVLRRDGQWATIRQCLEAAIDWLATHQTTEGFIASRRRNATGLFYQTWRDSHTAYVHTDGKILSLSRPNVYLEPQYLAIDSWRYAAKVFPERAKEFNAKATKLRDRVLEHFWDEDMRYFYGALEPTKDGTYKPMKTPTSAAGWLLDSTIFDGLPVRESQKYLSGIMHRLAQDDFVTPVGLRARAKGSDSALKVADYHGSWAVWPVDTFVYARGLHRQGFNKLAKEQEKRLFAGINTTGSYNEYFLVNPENKVLYHPHHVPMTAMKPTVLVQIIPEHNLAWTISAALLIEKGALPHFRGKPAAWQKVFEDGLIDWLPPLIQNPVEEVPFRPANIRGAARVSGIAMRKLISEYVFQR